MDIIKEVVEMHKEGILEVAGYRDGQPLYRLAPAAMPHPSILKSITSDNLEFALVVCDARILLSVKTRTLVPAEERGLEILVIEDGTVSHRLEVLAIVLPRDLSNVDFARVTPDYMIVAEVAEACIKATCWNDWEAALQTCLMAHPGITPQQVQHLRMFLDR
jgi:hypothetical protein